MSKNLIQFIFHECKHFSYFTSDCCRVNDKLMVSRATDDRSAKMLWELSCDLVRLEDHLKIN
jgi:hypothetical protein